MGRITSYLLAKYGEGEVIVTSRSLERARKTAQELNERAKSDRISGVAVNIEDRNELVNAMKDIDVVVNMVGPYYEYGTKVMNASIEAGIDYADICDEFIAVKEMVKLNEKAKKAGVRQLICLGSSPGLSNIQARYSANRLDRVNEIHIAWASSQTDPFGPSVMKHCIHCFSGSHQYLNGKLVEVPPFSGRKIIEFLPPVGEVEVVYFDHPEPFTIPMYIKGVNNVTVRGGIFPADIHQLIEPWTKSGLNLTEPLKVDGYEITPIDFLTSATMKIMSMKKDVPSAAAQRVDVIGEKNSEIVRHIHTSVGTMAGGTCVSAFIGIMMMVKNKIKEFGVLPPETIDPELFFEELKRRRKLAYTEIGYLYNFRRIEP